MSRPKPTILLQHVDETDKAIQICESDAIYAVCYRGQPVMLRTLANIEVPYPGPKYAKTSWTNPGHAFNCAERLNKIFNTTEFTVHKMTVGRVLHENIST